MANESIPRIGSRVSVQVFAGDLLAHAGLISIESYPSSGYSSVLLSDGGGVKVAVTGDPASLRTVLQAALALLPDGGEQP
jgi:hypothetical protein